MKIIFLDINGVLNADDDFGGKSKPNPYICDGEKGISKSKLARLKLIAEATGSRIVLSSKYNSNYMKYLHYKLDPVGKYLENKLKTAGLYIYETTFQSHNVGNKAYEINCWLKETCETIENYVILDDELLEDLEKYALEGHFVQIDPKTGLTSELAEQIICLLNA